MQIAFTAPMKPPDHPVPSGDRTMARLLIKALGRAGHRVEVASRLRTWQPSPDVGVLEETLGRARREADALVAGWAAGRDGPPEAWLTYHLYHKAPDLIGPRVATSLDIPYVVVEASRAGKRARDGWARHLALADEALVAADAVCAVHRHDLAGLTGVVAPERLHLLPPFIEADRFSAPREPGRPGTVRLLAVGMMRDDTKQASYRLLAEALARLADLDCHLTIVGDGPRRGVIEQMFAAGRTTFAGEAAGDDLPAIYAAHDLLVWPAVNEAYGFVFLEAQAAGLPVVGGAVLGVPEIVVDGRTGLLVPPGDAAAFAGAVRSLAGDPARRQRMGRAAASHARSSHDIGAGARRLEAVLAAAAAVRTGAPARHPPAQCRTGFAG